ncbi:MAG: ABC transporter ATP-binding protein [Janthinobacterium lividum]
MTAGTALVVQDLHVRYGAVSAVQGISLEVAPAEAVAIIGSNGAGKTSLLRGIMGLVPSRGVVTVGGRKVTGQATNRIARDGVGYVPEGRELFSGMTVTEELLIGGRRLAAAERRQRLDRVLALFPRLAERHSQLTRTMSGGEQQMVAIGRTLMMGPGLLLLDEPSLGLAPVIQDAVYEALTVLRDEGMTILLVEQNANRALNLCSRAYVLALGTFVATGPSEVLRHDPDVRAAYLGA